MKIPPQADPALLVSITRSATHGLTALLSILACTAPIRSCATPGDTDPSFNAGPVLGPASSTQIAVQADGKIIVGGAFNSVGGFGRTNLARLNSDGSVDNSFLNGLAGPTNRVWDVALQTNGQILIGGEFTMVNGAARNGIARLNASDGSVDGSFLNGLTGANSAVYCIALQTNGQILIGGDFNNVNGVTRNLIARLNADGSLDGAFMTNSSGANGDVYALAVQSDGKILIGGAFALVNGAARGGIARLNTDGSVDNSFMNGLSGADAEVNAVVVQSDGKILLGGAFNHVNGTSRNGIARLNSDGSLDTAFLNGQAGANYYVYSLALQTNRQILVGGAFTSINGFARNRFARLNADGSLEDWFLYHLSGANDFVGSLALQSDGRIIIGGNFSTVNTMARSQVARLLTAYDAPQIANSAMTNNQFGFNLIGAPGQTLVIQASTDLAGWTPIGTNVLGNIGPAPFSDSQTAFFKQRFYRLKQ
jgi:uncharacterized delta-60 repeat protein